MFDFALSHGARVDVTDSMGVPPPAWPPSALAPLPPPVLLPLLPCCFMHLFLLPLLQACPTACPGCWRFSSAFFSATCSPLDSSGAHPLRNHNSPHAHRRSKPPPLSIIQATRQGDCGEAPGRDTPPAPGAACLLTCILWADGSTIFQIAQRLIVEEGLSPSETVPNFNGRKTAALAQVRQAGRQNT